MAVELMFGGEYYQFLHHHLRHHWRPEIYWRHPMCLRRTLELELLFDADNSDIDAHDKDDHYSRRISRIHEHCHDWHIEAARDYWPPPPPRLKTKTSLDEPFEEEQR